MRRDIPVELTHLALRTTRQLLRPLLSVFANSHGVDHAETAQHQLKNVKTKTRKLTTNKRTTEIDQWCYFFKWQNNDRNN